MENKYLYKIEYRPKYCIYLNDEIVNSNDLNLLEEIKSALEPNYIGEVIANYSNIQSKNYQFCLAITFREDITVLEVDIPIFLIKSNYLIAADNRKKRILFERKINQTNNREISKINFFIYDNLNSLSKLKNFNGLIDFISFDEFIKSKLDYNKTYSTNSTSIKSIISMIYPDLKVELIEFNYKNNKIYTVEGDFSKNYLYEGEQFNGLKLINRIFNISLGSRLKKNPLISVIIPVYNRDYEIIRLAESIVDQDYTNLEVIFILNGSPEETKNSIKKAKNLLFSKRIRTKILDYHSPFGSATIPRDIGCHYANGQLLLFLDSDDYLTNDFFNYFEKNQYIEEAIYYPLKIFKNHGREMGKNFPYEVIVGHLTELQKINIYETLLNSGNIFNNSGVIISKNIFSKVKGINHNLKYCEDYYLWLKVANLTNKAICHEGIVNISLHPNNNEIKVGNNEDINLVKELYLEKLF